MPAQFRLTAYDAGATTGSFKPRILEVQSLVFDGPLQLCLHELLYSQPAYACSSIIYIYMHSTDIADEVISTGHPFTSIHIV